jgi:hypothetical protein
MEPTTFTIWKWADNDLPGKPNEVFATLMSGRMHPALQPFDACPILRRIEGLALRDRRQGKEWDWQVQPDKETGATRFLHVTAPTGRYPGLPCESLGETVYRRGLVAYDEHLGRLAYGGPKRFCLEFSSRPWAYDFEEADLPVLVRQLYARHGSHHGALVNHRQDFLGICMDDGCYHNIEWRRYIGRVEGPFEQWQACSKRTPTGTRGKYRLRFSEVLAIARSFYRQEPRSTVCRWRDISQGSRDLQDSQRGAGK